MSPYYKLVLPAIICKKDNTLVHSQDVHMLKFRYILKSVESFSILRMPYQGYKVKSS